MFIVWNDVRSHSEFVNSLILVMEMYRVRLAILSWSTLGSRVQYSAPAYLSKISVDVALWP
jgi:hypothetical protein